MALRQQLRHSVWRMLTCWLAWCITARHVCAADWLYWTAVDDDGRYAVRRSGRDGSNVEGVVTGIVDSVEGMAVDRESGKLYWIERGTNTSQVVSADLDGRDRKLVKVVDGSASRLALNPVERRLYYTVAGISSGYGIRRFSLAGGDVEDVISREVGDLAIDPVGGRIYWVEQGAPGLWGTDLWSAAPDGTDPRPIVHHTLEHHTTGICLDSVGGKIYWATVDYRETHAQVVYRANLDGSNTEPVTTANSGLDDWPVYIDLDADSRTLYWVNGEDGVFFQVGSDGGEARRFHEDSGPYGPFDLAVVSGNRRVEFRRADADGSGVIDLSDPIATLSVLFLGGQALSCLDAADVNDDGELDVTDAVAALTYLFLGGFDIPAPGQAICGEDPTDSDALDCREYGSCPR